jgi:hypothetical protein
VGNVVIARWRKRFFERTMNDVGALIDLANERMGMPVLLLNDASSDLVLPNSMERALLRAHIMRHGVRVAIAVDVLSVPAARLLAAIVNGAILVSRVPSAFVLVHSLEAARRWGEPFARHRTGPMPWTQVASVVEELRLVP